MRTELNEWILQSIYEYFGLQASLYSSYYDWWNNKSSVCYSCLFSLRLTYIIFSEFISIQHETSIFPNNDRDTIPLLSFYKINGIFIYNT